MIVHWKAILTSTVAAYAALFAVSDCDPHLFVVDKLLASTGGPASQFRNKRIWIIGASSGIGEELAYQLAPYAKSLIISARSEDKLRQVRQKCSCPCEILPIDVSDLNQLEHVPIPDCCDIVILNAGQGHLSPALETTVDTSQRMLQTNILWIMALLPRIITSSTIQRSTKKLPQIAVTNSIAGLVPVPLSAPYAASKHALTGYLASLCAEMPSLRITSVCPGPVDTNFHGNSSEYRRRSQLKMATDRCARLYLSALVLGASEYIIAPQPTLLACYLPRGLCRVIVRLAGPRRVDIWRQGLDLYDPKSWRSNQ